MPVYSVDKDGKESLIIKDAIVCPVSDEITMDGKYRSVTAFLWNQEKEQLEIVTLPDPPEDGYYRVAYSSESVRDEISSRIFSHGTTARIMIRCIIVSVSSGILFGIMDGFLNANPMAQRLYSVFKPIARETINISAGFFIDIVYGFTLAGIFILLPGRLPFASGLLKGLVFGLLVWFLRVVMQVASLWMMFNIPASTLLYMLIGGRVKMLVLGLLYGLTLRHSI